MHAGHIEVVGGILANGLADKVWIMPCRRNPLKEGSETMEDEKRLNLIRQAIKYGEAKDRWKPGQVELNDMELSMPEPSYTCDTLEALRKERPDVSFRLVVGADSYLQFDRWKNHEWIERNFHPVVYPRPGYDIEEVKPSWTLLRGVRETPVSSTELRESIRKGTINTDMMPWINYGRP